MDSVGIIMQENRDKTMICHIDAEEQQMTEGRKAIVMLSSCGCIHPVFFLVGTLPMVLLVALRGSGVISYLYVRFLGPKLLRRIRFTSISGEFHPLSGTIPERKRRRQMEAT
ncbi:hypothetical protein HPP92_011443 [Vanilla planifolia]|uniref:Transmembrane protein n=1 Tax=Vanilla planifolia TaxID=51239 RepID=A0A835R2V5_VANPL|nr:hypothetical protein HPP92_011443 [Vanilla planifolia]